MERKYNSNRAYNSSRNNNNDNHRNSLPAWTGGQLQPEFVSGMKSRTPFIVASNSERNDLGGSVIMLQWPYIVCRVHAFKTSSTQKTNPLEHLPENYVANKAEHDRREYLHVREKAWRNAKRAKELDMSVRDYVEDYLGEKYDEEYDEPRIVGKVPGMNIYLEVYGSLMNVDYSVSPVGAFGEGQDKADELAIRKALTWACAFYRGFVRIGERKEYATKKSQFQPMSKWHEDFIDNDKRMFIPRECGIGHTNIDSSRRDPRFPHHLFDEEEKAELALLKSRNDNSAHPLSPAELQQRAAANVAARRMLSSVPSL